MICATGACNSLHRSARIAAMALEHALLVALRERPASGLELARRFDRSIGFFWHATHQQIYRVLARMEGDGWVTRRDRRRQTGRPDKKVYAVAALGAQALADVARRRRPRSSRSAATWPSSSAVRRTATARPCCDGVREHLAEHATPAGGATAHCASATTPTPTALDRRRPRPYLVLRGGIRLEEFWIDWLTEYLERTHARSDHRRTDPHLLEPITIGGLDAAQPGGDGLDAHRPRGPALGPAQAGGVLRRARPRRRRA